ncbi:MAG: L-histidine N(alpha)-methyltransferase [Microthrixaceae bacterium]|nr:L-histidine N(alpha)-methyltransferase [Microthrixaceae bacterium]
MTRTDDPPADGGPPAITVEVCLDQSAWSTHLAEETLAGLRDDPPWIPPVWFYDETGSALFDEITRLEEYYPTAAERQILTEHAAEIAEVTGMETLAELGAGTSEKTALLLDAGEAAGTLVRFAPFDCSEEVLRQAAAQIAGARPSLTVHAVVGDFNEHLGALPMDGVCVLAFLGSTIGNMDPPQRKGFLAEVAATLDADDWFLLGTDLAKSEDELLPAYDDSAGVTARFNLNALAVINSELLADFDLDAFTHRALWDHHESRIEMQLVARTDQTVRVSALEGAEVSLAEGDHIRTEISTKFTPSQVHRELSDAGMLVEHTWFDDRERFMVTLARRA